MKGVICDGQLDLTSEQTTVDMKTIAYYTRNCNKRMSCIHFLFFYFFIFVETNNQNKPERKIKTERLILLRLYSQLKAKMQTFIFYSKFCSI